MMFEVIDFVKTNRFTKPICNKLRKHRGNSGLDYKELVEPVPYRNDDKRTRYNLILPTLRKTKVFGGILTAINVVKLLAEQNNAEVRIIVILNEKYSQRWTYSIGDVIENAKIEYIRETKNVEILKNDFFILTSWETAYVFLPILEWQINTYRLIKQKAVYLIQDFEPCFNAWSTNYLLAETTYRTLNDRIIALYNSKELMDYFCLHGYSFSDELYFEPALNDRLKNELINCEKGKREKLILIYGRPGVQRNAFEIIKNALDLWSGSYKNAKEWKIISLGDEYENIKLKNNIIEMKGKVSLEDYSAYLKKSYIGISLMVSPHPSYPPLEMSVFGVRTITNQFENKDLSYFNNIISLERCLPKDVAQHIEMLCDEYGIVETEYDLDSAFVDGSMFKEQIYKVGRMLNEMATSNLE